MNAELTEQAEAARETGAAAGFTGLAAAALTTGLVAAFLGLAFVPVSAMILSRRRWEWTLEIRPTV